MQNLHTTHVNPVGRLGRFHSWEFDYALLVLLDSEYRLKTIWQAEPQELERLQAKVVNPKVGLNVSAFKKVAHLVYGDGAISMLHGAIVDAIAKKESGPVGDRTLAYRAFF